MAKKTSPKLVRYNASNTRLPLGSRLLAPLLTVRSNGEFRMNRELMSLLACENGGNVEFLRDEANNEWYLVMSPAGLKARLVRNDVGLFQSTILRKALKDSLECTDATLRIPVARKGQRLEELQCHALLTSALLQ
jgi:hypothetical protein